MCLQQALTNFMYVVLVNVLLVDSRIIGFNPPACYSNGDTARLGGEGRHKTLLKGNQ